MEKGSRRERERKRERGGGRKNKINKKTRQNCKQVKKGEGEGAKKALEHSVSRSTLISTQ